MSKIKNNPIMKGASGMLGDVVVYREFRGNVIMSNRPKKREMLTPQQSAAKSKFLRAVKYGKKQIADPVMKAEYQPTKTSRFTSAYAVAVADYLGAPVVNNIDVSQYGGAVDDRIYIQATDNFKVTVVTVVIFDADAALIEQGEAVLQDDSDEDFIYVVTTPNAVVAGSRIVVTVRDKPGNTTVEEKVL